jgi:hypothetical protein
MITPLAKFIDWSALQVLTWRTPRYSHKIITCRFWSGLGISSRWAMVTGNSFSTSVSTPEFTDNS